MSVIKSGEPQTHSGMLPRYVIMKGTISIHWEKMAPQLFVIEFYGYWGIPSLVVDVSDVSYGLTWTDDHSKSDCAEITSILSLSQITFRRSSR